MRLVTLDTGVATGIALWDSDRPDDIWSTHLQRDETEDFMAEKIPLCDVVVSERLVISMATAKKGRQVQVSIELVGLIRYLCRVHGVKHEEQLPAEAKRFATDQKLKMMKWHVKGGPDHQRDARRHALTWLAETRRIDLVKLMPNAS